MTASWSKTSAPTRNEEKDEKNLPKGKSKEKERRPAAERN